MTTEALIESATTKHDDDVNSRIMLWASSFRRCDPRYQILRYFDDVAQESAVYVDTQYISPNTACPAMRIGFRRASVFTVWRPTSIEAIRKMMKGEGVGKGLDIKGKSAKKGMLSAFVPFLQIHVEDDKKLVQTQSPDERMRVYFSTRTLREEAIEALEKVSNEMTKKIHRSKYILSETGIDKKIREKALQVVQDWEMDDPTIERIEDCAESGCFGIEVAKRLFWEATVARQDCTREHHHDTGRPSEPAFQDMNLASVTYDSSIEKDGPRAVVWQYSDSDALCPQSFLMAYQENGRVLPVVSDFDCFIMGTRGVTYQEQIPEDQVDVMEWCISQCETILQGPVTADSWTRRWLDVLKEAAMDGFHPDIPQFGFGDPKSYSIMENAIGRLQPTNGAVRHGAECFNYYFPQELDDRFCVISDTLGPPGTVPWKYVNLKELQELLCQKIDEGFTFPLNPKWVLCDDGWKDVSNKLLASQRSNVQDSIRCWYPDHLRERIRDICLKHPEGFERLEGGNDTEFEGTEAMDLAEQELHRFCSRLGKTLRKVKHGGSKVITGVGGTVTSVGSGLGKGVGTTAGGVAYAGKGLARGVQKAGKGMDRALSGSAKSGANRSSKVMSSSVGSSTASIGSGLGKSVGTAVQGATSVGSGLGQTATDGVVSMGKGLASGVRVIGKGIDGAITGSGDKTKKAASVHQSKKKDSE